MPELVLTNAQVVLEDVVLPGTVVARGGQIVAVERGPSRVAGAMDLAGDYLLPGLVDLHTDNLEKHFQPRSGVTWDGVAAAIAHDGQIASSGITTVFDSLTIGAADGWDIRAEMIEPMLRGLDHARSHGMLRVDHRLHLRCEVTHPAIVAIFEAHAAVHEVAMMSLMDHAPGRSAVAGHRCLSRALPADLPGRCSPGRGAYQPAGRCLARDRAGQPPGAGRDRQDGRDAARHP